MSSTSGSEPDADEQWDDMAIVRAFEDALSDRRTRDGAASKSGSRRQKGGLRAKAKNTARSASVDEGEEQGDMQQAAPTTVYNQSSYQYNPATPAPSQYPQQQSDVYQAAYAQAYAHLQAQFQAASTTAPPSAPQYPQQSFSAGAQAPAFPTQPSYYPPSGPAVPPMPSMQSPFPGVPNASPFQGAAAGDDGLSSLLLSWYQSGYYTGRFQAMQEMKMRGQR